MYIFSVCKDWMIYCLKPARGTKAFHMSSLSAVKRRRRRTQSGRFSTIYIYWDPKPRICNQEIQLCPLSYSSLGSIRFSLEFRHEFNRRRVGTDRWMLEGGDGLLIKELIGYWTSGWPTQYPALYVSINPQASTFASRSTGKPTGAGKLTMCRLIKLWTYDEDVTDTFSTYQLTSLLQCGCLPCSA